MARRTRRYRVGAVVAAVAALAATVAATPANATPDRPPTAPTHLTVDDRSDPLAVQGVPQFGWLPQDPDGNEVQTAYQIVVTRPHGGTVWDSGKVASSAESWVSYGGPTLSPGTTYDWSVRTWDRAGRTSPFAGATFDSGLGDQDWSGAEWISRATTGNDAKNEYTLARKTTAVTASPVVRARAYVASMGTWQLDVNGVVVDRTSSYGYAGEGYYDVSDITRDVRAGRPLAIGVLYHYWTCTCQGRANGPASPGGPSGLLVKVVVQHADGTTQTVVSDGSWRVTQDSAEQISTLTYRNSDAGDRVEYIDATKEITGWDEPGFDDSAWSAPVVIGPHPRPEPASCSSYEGGSAPCAFTHLTAEEAHIATRTVHPVSVLHLPDGTVFADFGKVYSAVPAIRLRHGTAGTQLTVTTSYRENNTTSTAATAAGASTIGLASTANLHVGDRITVDAPADGYGAGHPETRTVTAVDGTTATVAPRLSKAHASGVWVENSRSGTSGLDTQGSNMRFYYTEKAGSQVAQPMLYWGWRYIQISDPGENLTAADITAVVQNTDAPASAAATFTSSNPELDAVFQLMQRSALQSEQNTFLDTPTREKGQFLGDTVDESFASMESLDERSLTREAIVDFIHSQARYWPNGALNAVYPNGDAKRDIPDYTEMFPEWVMRYYQLTGDTTLLAQAYPTMRNVADYVDAAVNSSHLVYQLPGGSGPYQNGIIDWPAPMRYDTVVTGNGAETVVNAIGVGANRAVAQAAAVLGNKADATTYGGHADSLVSAVNAQLRDPATGLYSDGLATGTLQPIAHYSEHAQTYAVDYGIAPASSYPALGDYITAQGMRQGPMDLRELETALRLTDRPDTLVSLLTDPNADGPAKILAEGGTYMWEQWDPGCTTVAPCGGSAVSQSDNTSFSHGWGSSGIVDILEGLLGVQVTGVGASDVTIAPPDKGLAHARGTEWTERGPVSVDWTRTAKGADLTVDVPDNVTATVELPAGAGSRYVVAGAGGARLVGVHGGRAVYTVGSGRTRFQAVRA
ncbi:MAG TPA: alpha-L-rhamnosidase N-terminal domain-containing protein [Pseudonocardiaceae bacterium]|nr:alpha-L-rhamnosidase N-terminal domain-containing protein [Pseudonocardiaceae bacterium]